MQNARVAILGSGSWGTALAKIVMENERYINWYIRRQEVIDEFCRTGRNPGYLNAAAFNTSRICFSTDINEVIANSDVLILAIPSPYIRQVFRDINPNIDANQYSVAYMWGTSGIIYNTEKVTAEEAGTWDIIRNPKFAGQILIKDAPRDVYGPVLIHLKQKELQAGEIALADLMEDSSDESIAMVEDYMKQARELVAGWEADFGKEQMTQERGYINFTWSGDAVWAIEEGAEVGVDLKYVVPTEGSTVWFDGWVIPKYAVNVKAATYFIDFMCRPDIAIRNMEETGYVSANGDISVMESQIDESYDPVDLSYFFGEDATEVCVNPVLYPDKSVMDMCVLEHDWGDKTEKLIAMWSRVKGSDTNAMTVIVISVFILGMLALGLYNKFFSKKAKRRRAARRRARNK